MAENRRDNAVQPSRHEIVGLFPFYLSGTASSEERKEVEEHLSKCVVCQVELKFFSDLQRVGRKLFGNDE